MFKIAGDEKLRQVRHRDQIYFEIQDMLNQYIDSSAEASSKVPKLYDEIAHSVSTSKTVAMDYPPDRIALPIRFPISQIQIAT